MNEKIRIDYDVQIPMRDGVLLRANVFGPADDAPYPALLVRFPYVKNAYEHEWGKLNPLYFARAGYRVVLQDCRGTGNSDGDMDFDRLCQGADGYDTVEWLAAQPWCDGNVGMYGLSFFGFTQLLTAETRPPHLKTICPWQQSGLPRYYGGFTTGSLHLMWLLQRVQHRLQNGRSGFDKEEAAQLLNQVQGYLDDFAGCLMYAPEAENPAAFIPGLPVLEDYARRLREYDDPNGPIREGRPIAFENIDIPCFFLGGWYDETSKNGPIENWQAIAQTPMGAQKLKHCKMVMGPWNHGDKMPDTVGERSFGANAGLPYGHSIPDMLLRWFDYHLKGLDNGVQDEAPVALFTMGTNEWRYEHSWPLPDTKLSYYLHSDGAAASSLTSGRLDRHVPDNEPDDLFLADPNKFVPFRAAGISAECQNQISLEARPDVLTYTSEVLDTDLNVTGEVTAELYISSSCPDTDFVCKLTEVYPDGRSLNITDGAVRASYNNTYTRRLLEQGETRKLLVYMGNTCNVFKKGNRIRLDIAGSGFPKYDRNHNVAARIGTSAQTQVAENHVYHDAVRASKLVLPIV